MNDEMRKEIGALAARFSELQRTLGLKNGAFAARYRKYVGSEKAWNAVKDNRWDGYLNPEKLVAKLREFARFIDAAQSYDADEFVQGLPFVRNMNARFEALLGADKDRRCLLCLSPQGVGKSWWASSIVKDDPARRTYVRVPFTWREKPMHLTRGLASALNLPEKKNPAAQEAELIEGLRKREDHVVVIDEAHNGGVALMKLLKDLIDETRARFVYLAFPTEFDIVSGSGVGAIGEARQFLRRCLRPVFDTYRSGIGAADVVDFMAGSGVEKNGELRAFAAEVAPVLAGKHNLADLSDALANARAEAEDADARLTLALVKSAIEQICGVTIRQKED